MYKGILLKKILKVWSQLKTKEEINDNIHITDIFSTDSKVRISKTSSHILDNVKNKSSRMDYNKNAHENMKKKKKKKIT